MRNLAALLFGMLFALGLAVSGMTQPAKIIGFLDVAGHWDPTLAFVMAGALALYVPAYRMIRRRDRPVLAPAFAVPSRTDIDRQLVGGAALFGLGWGLGGLCPAPAITSLPTASHNALGVGAGMAAGIVLVRVLRRVQQSGAVVRREA